VKYMLLIYQNPATWRDLPEPDRQAIMSEAGAFAEAKEQMVGYCVVDCETQERAVEIAARWPDARLWGMEVRPLLSPGGVEM
jgi:hypothetical protein